MFNTPFLSIVSDSSLNIKVDKRWISFVRNWISNFTVVQQIKKHNLATKANIWTKVVTVTNIDRL